jgi:tetratricopeptide (TPR) repeat protein
MVGLTDSTIARHPEEPIVGMETTWKERRHNSRYLLTRAPEYIVFSTGIKPSAPAERALCLFPAFLKSYRQIGWFYRARDDADGTLATAFKKMRPLEGDLTPTLPVSYVQHYQRGIDLSLKGDYPAAIQHFDQALQSQPSPESPDLLYLKAFAYLRMNRHEEAFDWYNRCVAMDSMVFQAQKDLYMYTELMGDTATSAIHRAWVKKLTPWYWPKVEADVEAWKEEARRQGMYIDGGAP